MKKTIGRREKINLPKWGLKNITAKIDTGAYTSSIHCEFAEEKIENSVPVLYFKVLSPEHKKYKNKLIRTEDFTEKVVKNSFGQEEVRFKVKTKVVMFGEEFEAEFTLTDRSKMRIPILLGRKLLRKRFLVDVDSINLSKKSQE
jgi:hypothetical protein